MTTLPGLRISEFFGEQHPISKLFEAVERRLSQGNPVSAGITAPESQVSEHLDPAEFLSDGAPKLLQQTCR
jgi:hypothetical protein